jgi:hypothetical protein
LLHVEIGGARNERDGLGGFVSLREGHGDRLADLVRRLVGRQARIKWRRDLKRRGRSLECIGVGNNEGAPMIDRLP